jgi:type II secretory ATPase GspE/PulE/Tfp pilus assembly ATPase PilB-like protein
MTTKSTIDSLKDAIVAGDVPLTIESTMKMSLEKGASDIHIEPHKNIVQIRLRIDGILQILVEYPPNLHPGIISRIKIMSNL